MMVFKLDIPGLDWEDEMVFLEAASILYGLVGDGIFSYGEKGFLLTIENPIHSADKILRILNTDGVTASLE